MALTDEQKRMRASAYGASEVATVLGIGPGKLIDLYVAKTTPPPDEDPADANEAMELGNLLEEPIARIYARRTGTLLVPVQTIVHPSRPLAIATPDRARFLTEEAWLKAKTKCVRLSTGELVVGREALEHCDRLVEVKSTGSRYRRDYGAAGTGKVPEEKAVQVTWQMGVALGQRVVDLPVLFRGEWGVRIETFSVPFNADLFELTYEAVERFHQDHVLARKPPEPDGSDRYDDAIKRMFPQNRAPSIPATPEDEALILRFAQFREIAARAKRLRNTYAQQLKVRIGEAGGITTDGLGHITWTRSRDGSEVNWQKAAHEFQTLAAMCIQLFDSLKATGEQISDANRKGLELRLKAIIPAATKRTGGFRSLRPYLKGDAELTMNRLRVTLDALEQGDAAPDVNPNPESNDDE